MMAGDDFFALFEELGVPPNCSLDEFKLAFRRRVAQLHPDRNGDAAEAARLQNLIAAYDAARQFHRQHGRLPGYAAVAQPPDAWAAQHDIRPGMPTVARGSRNTLAYILVSILTAALIWWWSQPVADDAPSDVDSAGSPLSEPAPIQAPATLRARAQPSLTLGMDKADVATLEGAPVSEGTDRWDYGPSWIGFKCGQVSDWYNSPLRPLKTNSAHPPADVLRVSALDARRCNAAAP